MVRCLVNLGSAGLPFDKRVRRLLALEGVEGLFGYPEGVDRGGHATVEHHLGDYLTDLLFGDANVEGTLNVTPDQLGAMSQHGQGSDSAEAAGLKVDRRTVVDFPIDHGIHQLHDLRRKFGHGRRRAGVASRSVISVPEVGSSPA